MKRKSKPTVSADLSEAIVLLAASMIGYAKMTARVVDSCKGLAHDTKLLLEEMARPSVALIEGSAMFYDGMTMVGGFIGDRIDEIRGYAVTCAHAAKATRDASGMPTLEAACAALESAMRKASGEDAS